jgi:nucleoside-diphosphate-sugar epimerase
MRVLVAGATGTFGRTLTEALLREGHEVIGLTRSPARAREIERVGGRATVADVFERDDLIGALAGAEPEAVISLLITLPRNGPLRPSQIHPNLRLWGTGVPNLIEAARSAGAGRIVAESFVFAYGYGQYGPPALTEGEMPEGGAVIRGQAEILSGLRGMERAVTQAEGIDGIVLRYGGRHGASVPMRITMARALRCRLPVLPGGGHALLPFIELGDSAKAASAALKHGRSGEIYNVVDDRPVEMRDYAAALSSFVGAAPPRSIPLWLVRRAAPYLACVLDHTRLPVSNEKAKRELGWEPSYRTVYDAFEAGVG